jgi:hypothetical protein
MDVEPLGHLVHGQALRLTRDRLPRQQATGECLGAGGLSLRAAALRRQAPGGLGTRVLEAT